MKKKVLGKGGKKIEKNVAFFYNSYVLWDKDFVLHLSWFWREVELFWRDRIRKIEWFES